MDKSGDGRSFGLTWPFALASPAFFASPASRAQSQEREEEEEAERVHLSHRLSLFPMLPADQEAAASSATEAVLEGLVAERLLPLNTNPSRPV